MMLLYELTVLQAAKHHVALAVRKGGSHASTSIPGSLWFCRRESVGHPGTAPHTPSKIHHHACPVTLLLCPCAFPLC